MTNTKEKFIDTTSRLMETQGYHATGLNQIIKESGAPKGSLYYHFPDGKEELASAAVQQAGNNLISLIKENLREDIPIAEAVRDFVFGVAQGVEVTHYQSGGPLTAIAMETATTSERINQACREAFLQIQIVFEDKMLICGLNSHQASHSATFITAAIEGGIILSRTLHNGDPLRTVAEQLYQYLKGLSDE